MNPRKIILTEDAAALAEQAAARIVARIAENDGRIAICLTGGSTPKRLYELLATERWRSRMPWERTHWFMGDDRFVPHDHPDSNIGMARRAFLDSCAAPDTIHAIPTALVSPDAAAAAYEADMRAFFGNHTDFDIVLMGIGPDGHTASLFPDDAATRETSRWVVGVPKAHVPPFVPRVSLTFPALAGCREMLFLIDGAKKHDIVVEALRDELLPAAHARSKLNTVWMMDRAASEGAA